MTPYEQAKSLLDAGKSKVKVKYNDGSTEVVRLFIGNNSCAICRFSRRSSRHGYTMNFNDIVAVSAIQTKKTKEQKWRDGWNKVIKRLKASGLWEEIIKDIQIALDMGYETLQAAYKEYWDIPYGVEREVGEAAYLEKYPALACANEDGKKYVNTTIVWNYSKIAKVKKMCFAKGLYNESLLSDIKAKMTSKEKCSIHGRYRYDVTFEYNPEKNHAWYSEEYKDAGNGHYYLALDATHALFAEDD